MFENMDAVMYNKYKTILLYSNIKLHPILNYIHLGRVTERKYFIKRHKMKKKKP